MKRVYIAIAILILVLSVCIFCSAATSSRLNDLAGKADAARSVSYGEDYIQMKKSANEIKKEWEENLAFFGAFLTHTHYSDLDEYINLLCISAEEKNKKAYIDKCNLVIYEIAHLKEANEIKFKNII